MSDRFTKNWEKEKKDPMSTKIKEAVKPAAPLKPRIDAAIRGLQAQTNKLEQLQTRLTDRDKNIFAKVVDAYTKHDQAHASIYANELAEIRKMSKMIMQSELALEQIVLRLQTVEELGDVVVSLSPAMSVIRRVGKGIAGVMPEAEGELGEIGELLSGVLMEAGQSSGGMLSFDTMNEDATKILGEAATVAEQKMKDRFPEMPASTPSGTRI
jgi:division protein CdvB (Snf7/Vps24/ESCRT-III family)